MTVALRWKWSSLVNELREEVNCKLLWLSHNELHDIRFYVRSMCSIYGSILFWMGCWNLLTERFSRRITEADDGPESFQIIEASGAREIGYTSVGFSLLLITDTLYGNAGLRGGYLPPKPIFVSRWFTVARCTVGLLGSVLFWTGTYDWIDSYTWPPSLLREIVYALIGLFLLFLTKTFLVMAFVYPPKGVQPPKIVADFHSPLQQHIFVIVRCVVSIIGQNLIWLGVWNTLEYYSESLVWREACYATLGLFLFVISNNFDASQDDLDQEEDEDPEGEDEKEERRAASPASQRERKKLGLATAGGEAANNTEYGSMQRTRNTKSTWWIDRRNDIVISSPSLRFPHKPAASVGRRDKMIKGDNIKKPSKRSVSQSSENSMFFEDNFTFFEGDYSDVHAISVVFAMRSVVALLGQVILTVGAWSLMDQYIFPPSQLRNGICAVIGLLFLIGTGTLLQSAAITPLVAAFWQPEMGYDFSGPCNDAFPTDGVDGRLDLGEEEAQLSLRIDGGGGDDDDIDVDVDGGGGGGGGSGGGGRDDDDDNDDERGGGCDGRRGNTALEETGIDERDNKYSNKSKSNPDDDNDSVFLRNCFGGDGQRNARQHVQQPISFSGQAVTSTPASTTTPLASRRCRRTSVSSSIVSRSPSVRISIASKNGASSGGGGNKSFAFSFFHARPLWSSPRARFHTEHQATSSMPDESSPLLAGRQPSTCQQDRAYLGNVAGIESRGGGNTGGDGLMQHQGYYSLHPHPSRAFLKPPTNEDVHPTEHDPLLSPEDNPVVATPSSKLALHVSSTPL